MGEVKNIKYCRDCEYFADGRFPVVKYYVDGELKSRFVGYSDRANGEVVDNFARKCEIKTNIIIYNETYACKDFKPKTWTRPNDCKECMRKTIFWGDGTFLCSGYPFFKCHRIEDTACPNGKIYAQRQYTLFDFMK